MTSLFQTLKLLISGRDLKGIIFRTKLSMIVTIAVLVIEIATFIVKWDAIPEMLDYEYDFDGIANNVFNKNWLWGNWVAQIVIVYMLLVAKPFLYKIKKIKKYVSDEKNEIIPIIDKRIKMFLVETAVLVVTTEQGYIFAIAKIVEEEVCDNLVTIMLIFWFFVLLIELFFDIKYQRNILKK